MIQSVVSEKLRLHPNSPTNADADFSDFKPFIKVKDPDLEKKFIGVLKELHQLTGANWKPTACYAAEYLEEQVQNAQNQGQLRDVKLRVKNFASGAHYHLVAEIDGETLVVDPFGVPTPRKNYHLEPQTITPFFGEISLAPKLHREIYQDSHELETKGYRRFTP